jgi:hypothetical protein
LVIFIKVSRRLLFDLEEIKVIVINVLANVDTNKHALEVLEVHPEEAIISYLEVTDFLRFLTPCL